MNASSLLMVGAAGTSAHNIGMDFLDVKREILDELKQVDRKVQEKYAKNQRRRQHQLSHKGLMGQAGEPDREHKSLAIIQDSSVQELRLERFINNLSHQRSRHELNADIGACSQTLAKMRSKSSSPVIRKRGKEAVMALKEQAGIDTDESLDENKQEHGGFANLSKQKLPGAELAQAFTFN